MTGEGGGEIEPTMTELECRFSVFLSFFFFFFFWRRGGGGGGESGGLVATFFLLKSIEQRAPEESKQSMGTEIGMVSTRKQLKTTISIVSDMFSQERTKKTSLSR